MLNFNYYVIDVGENYCYISQRNSIISLREAALEKDIDKLRLAKEIIKRNFKKKCMHQTSQEYKMVYINKVDKLSVETVVDTDSKPKVVIDPIISCSSFDLYLMSPGQSLCVKCQVKRNETEIRNISYDSIMIPKNKRLYK